MKAFREGMTDSKEYRAILSDIQADERVQQMKEYIQHGCVSTYEHCEHVARLSYKINRNLSLDADLETLLVGAMLHDFYLYNWHEEGDGSHHLHGFRHAERASANAKKYFDADEEVLHVIASHMWPLNLTRLPRSREAWIVCIADKYISLQETFFRRNRWTRKKMR